MIVKIKKLYEDSQLPKQMTEEAGALDVFCHSITKESEDLYTCHTGIAMTPPKGYRIALVPRSSLTKYNWVLGNHYGVGDRDFTGEYAFKFRAIPVGFTNGLTCSEFPYKVGDRIGQMFLEKVIDFQFEEVAELVVTERGAGGYGSTGLK